MANHEYTKLNNASTGYPAGAFKYVKIYKHGNKL